jgi:chromosome segregation ATPase
MSSDRWISVKQKIQSLLDRLQRLEAENDELHQKINQYEYALESQNESQESTNQEEVDLLKSNLTRKDVFIENLEDEVQQFRQKTSDLEEKIALQDNTLQIQKNTILDLSEQNKMIKLAKGMSTDKADTHELKIKINQLIRDIDRCIDLLND